MNIDESMVCMNQSTDEILNAKDSSRGLISILFVVNKTKR